MRQPTIPSLAVCLPAGNPEDDAHDAARWRTLCANFGNERDEATPGKQHQIRITLNTDGCEVFNPDGSLNFAATLAAIMDDEARIQSRATHAGTSCPHGVPHRWPCEQCDTSGVIPSAEPQGEK
jgi:hypothetical protein